MDKAGTMLVLFLGFLSSSVIFNSAAGCMVPSQGHHEPQMMQRRYNQSPLHEHHVQVSVLAAPLLFAFGDSYADVGNTPKSGPNISSAWQYPYGITWPQPDPAGRFSDGKISTDWIADLLGLPLYPPPYLYSAGQNISYGVNFAVGGAGVFKVFSNVSLDVQVDNFELFLRTDPYSKTALQKSLTYVSVGGNDYLAYGGSTAAERLVYAESVIRGIQANLQRLYDLGLRYVMVANIAQLDCVPLYTEKVNWTNCTGETGPLAEIHNSFLLYAVEIINARNPGARFIILDQYSAFSRLLSEADEQGFTDGLKPCCTGTTNITRCGDVDTSGKWLYTVCKHRGRAIFWDFVHPSMWAWHYFIDIITNQPNYILLAGVPTLKDWLQINDASQEPTAAPIPQPDFFSGTGQAQTALNCLLNKKNYSEAIGVLQSFSLESVQAENLGQVTVFIPSNDALTSTDQAFIDGVFSLNKVNEVAAYHVANGYFDYNTIASERPSHVISVTGERLPMYYNRKEVFIGLNLQAKVIDFDLCVMPDETVIHGIDHVLMPHDV